MRRLARRRGPVRIAVLRSAATALAVCVIAWAISLFHADRVGVRVWANRGVNVFSGRHRVAVAWLDNLGVAPDRRWDHWRTDRHVMTPAWFDTIAPAGGGGGVVVPWAVPTGVFAAVTIVAARRRRRPPPAFEVVTPTPVGTGRPVRKY